MSDPPKVGSFEDCRKVLESALEKVIGEAAGAVEFKFDESLKTKLTGLQLQVSLLFLFSTLFRLRQFQSKWKIIREEVRSDVMA